MRLSIQNALYVAGAILLLSALATQFERGELIFSTLLTLSAPVIFYMAYRKEHKKFISCATRGQKSWKFWLVATLAIAVLFGFGYSVGKLIYLWSH